MGMYDSVFIKCKFCGEEVEFQSKAGNCCLSGYTLKNAPKSILGDLHNAIEICPDCGSKIIIKTKVIAEAIFKEKRKKRQ